MENSAASNIAAVFFTSSIGGSIAKIIDIILKLRSDSIMVVLITMLMYRLAARKVA